MNLGAVAMLSVAGSLASALAAYLLIVGGVALFADGVSRGIQRYWGGMREYKQ